MCNLAHYALNQTGHANHNGYVSLENDNDMIMDHRLC